MAENDNKKPKKNNAIVTLDEKIKIFEEYLQTGEKIVGNTIYKGYPIGNWAIQLRKRVNDFYKGRTPKSRFKDEQLRKLKDLGLLQRQIDSTIDEKIYYLAQWRKRYPDVKMTGTNPPEDEIRKYAKSESDFEKKVEEYIRMQSYYIYIANRKNKGKLTPDQITDCKNANIKPEIFGYPQIIEDLAKVYGMETKDAYYINQNFGSIEQFVLLYRTKQLNNKDVELAKKILRSYVDVDQNLYSSNYEILLEDLYGTNNELVLYSSEEMNGVLETLTDRQKELINKRYGLENGEFKKYLELAKEENISRSGVYFIIKSALERIKKDPQNINRIFVISQKQKSHDIEDKKDVVDMLKEEIDFSNMVFKNSEKSSVEDIICDLSDKREKRDKLQEELSDLKSREGQAKELLEDCKDILGENKKIKGEK